ncbi:hypothetical protein ABPG75_007489 [Micractinium tetrahymenae]
MVGTRGRIAAQQGLLLAAVVQDDLAAVQRELAAGTVWTANGGLTALHLAAGFAGPAVLSALLEALAPGGVATGAQSVDALLTASMTSRDAHNMLLAEAADATLQAFRDGATPLHVAVFFGDAEAVQLLLEAGADPNVPDAVGLTAMHWATCSQLACSAVHWHDHRALKHPEIPRLLLAAGGAILEPACGAARLQPAPLFFFNGSHSPSAAAAYLEHALAQHEAGRWDSDACAPLQMQRAVNLAMSHCHPFFFRFWRRMQQQGLQRFHTLIQMGHTEAVRELLQEAGDALPPSSSSLVTAAIRAGRLAIVQLLLAHGAPVSAAAVRAALAIVPQPTLLRLLLQHGAPPVEEMRDSHFDMTCPILYLLQCSLAHSHGWVSAVGSAAWQIGLADRLGASLLCPTRPLTNHAVCLGHLACRWGYTLRWGPTFTASPPQNAWRSWRMQVPAATRHSCTGCRLRVRLLGFSAADTQPSSSFGLPPAGYRPHVYKEMLISYSSPPIRDCDPLVQFPQYFDIDGTNSWLWRAFTRPAWCPESYHQEPAAFRAACRALLLAAHRGGAAQSPAGRGRRRMQARGGSAAGLARLPADVLLQIIGLAARPSYLWM